MLLWRKDEGRCEFGATVELLDDLERVAHIEMEVFPSDVIRASSELGALGKAVNYLVETPRVVEMKFQRVDNLNTTVSVHSTTAKQIVLTPSIFNSAVSAVEVTIVVAQDAMCQSILVLNGWYLLAGSRSPGSSASY